MAPAAQPMPPPVAQATPAPRPATGAGPPRAATSATPSRPRRAAPRPRPGPRRPRQSTMPPSPRRPPGPAGEADPRRLFNNWPLKLAAVGLATLMYGGLALSQNTQTYTGGIPVQLRQRAARHGRLPPPRTRSLQVRYFAPSGVPVADELVRGHHRPGRRTTTRWASSASRSTSPVARSAGPRSSASTRHFATVELDDLVTRPDVPVKVVHRTGPGRADRSARSTVDPATVTVSGAASIVSKVDAVRADVVDPGGRHRHRPGRPAGPGRQARQRAQSVDVTPATARVTIPVFSDRQSRTLPVNPIVTGTPGSRVRDRIGDGRSAGRPRRRRRR